MDIIFAPTGYPESRLIANGYAPIGGALKTFFIIFSNFNDICEIIFVCDSSSLTIKKGNKLGNIAFMNRSIAICILLMLDEEKKISPKQNNIIKIVKI